MDNKDSPKSNIYQKLTIALSVALVVCVVFILSMLYGKDEFFAPEAVMTIPVASSASPSSFMLMEDEFIAAILSNSGFEHPLYTYGEKAVSGATVKIGIASDTLLASQDKVIVIGNLTLETNDDDYVRSAWLELHVSSETPDIIPDSVVLGEDIALAEAFLLAADSKLQMLSASEYNEILHAIERYDTYPSALNNTYGAYTVSFYPPNVNLDKKIIKIHICLN
jgi:hypothetical protein